MTKAEEYRRSIARERPVLELGRFRAVVDDMGRVAITLRSADGITIDLGLLDADQAQKLGAWLREWFGERGSNRTED